MHKLTVGLTILAAAVTGGALTGCAASSSPSASPPASAKASAKASAETSASAAAKAALGGLSHGGSGADPAQWVVDGTFHATGKPSLPLSGTITFRDASTDKSVSVSVGASGQFTLGLAAGTYTATPQAKDGGSPCAAPVTVTVRAGQQTKLSLACATA